MYSKKYLKLKKRNTEGCLYVPIILIDSNYRKDCNLKFCYSKNYHPKRFFLKNIILLKTYKFFIVILLKNIMMKIA